MTGRRSPPCSAWVSRPPSRGASRLARYLTLGSALGSALLLAACAQRVAPRDTTALPPPPEAASGLTAKPGWRHTRQAVAAAHPLAAEAGAQVLRDGGSALDAAIAAQMVLALVEPQSSGIGGGAFLLHWDGQRVRAYDGRETAPAAATESLWLDDAGQPLPFAAAMTSGRAVGVPGVVAMLEQAHRAHGTLPWPRLLAPAITLAEAGFPVSPRLHALLAADPALRDDPLARAHFYQPDGQPHPVGHRLRNPELAAVLRAVARDGAAALRDGPIAQAIVAAAQRPPRPGGLRLEDLRAYQPLVREPLCHDWTPAARPLRVCGFPPPSSGALAIGQILGLLARTPLAAVPPLDGRVPAADWLHAYQEASRLAFADRAAHVADPAFVAAPAGDWSSLLAPDYLTARAARIGPRRADTAPAGQPGQPVDAPLAHAPMPDQPEFGTSHLSVVDARGHAVAMTTTIEAAFGSRRFVSTDPARPGGFLLNNQLTDFSFSPRDAAGRPVANRVQPGKRPRSSMSPTLVFDGRTGELLMTAGSPGGALIIHYTAKALLGVWAWGLTPQAALDLPNAGSTGGPLLLETGRFPEATATALRARGHAVQATDMTSGAQALVRRDGVWLGGADPRREGVVAGD